MIEINLILMAFAFFSGLCCGLAMAMVKRKDRMDGRTRRGTRD